MIYVKKRQSSTIKSYVSAIKSKVTADGYKWSDNLVLLNTLSGACRLKNDKLKVRLPIKKNLLRLLIKELREFYEDQPYLLILYTAMFQVAYFGLFRVGEITMSNHSIKAKNVHINGDRTKMLIILYSSKTHSKANRPQKVKITADRTKGRKTNSLCPCTSLDTYMQIRGGYDNTNEPLFIFSDGTPVQAKNLRYILKKMLKRLNLNYRLYTTHSF